jgi:DNA primase
MSLKEQVANALKTLHVRRLERRTRELRTLIAEAQRRGDEAMLRQLAHEKLQVERELRVLD